MIRLKTIILFVLSAGIGLRRSFAVIMAMSLALNFILALALLLQQPETRTIVVPPTLAAEREVWTFDEAESQFIALFATVEYTLSA